MIEWDGDVEYDKPAMPAGYSFDDDVNPICGHHRRSQCLGCGACVSCDACYCGED